MRLLKSRFESLVHQRTMLLSLVLILLVLNFIQTLTLLLKSERTVMVPPVVSRTFWVEQNRISPSYLEEMTLFFADLILEVSPSSTSYKREIILRNAVPEGYGALKAKLIEDERRIKKERVVTSFQPIGIKVSPSSMSAEITGDLLRFVGAKRVSQSRDTYLFTYVYRNSRLLIKSFELLRSDAHG